MPRWSLPMRVAFSVSRRATLRPRGRRVLTNIALVDRLLRTRPHSTSGLRSGSIIHFGMRVSAEKHKVARGNAQHEVRIWDDI